MKQYNFLFDDGSQASITVEPTTDRHLNMKEEVETIKRVMKSIIRGRKIKSYEVIRV